MHHDQDPNGGETPPDRPTEQLPPVGDSTPTVEHPIPPAGEQPPAEHHAPPAAEHPHTPSEQFPPATDHGYVTPPPPPHEPPGDTYGQGPTEPQGPPPRKHRGRLVAAIVAGVLLLGGVAVAGVMVVNMVSGTPDAMSKMVPAGDQVYVTAFLDPGADQKLNLRDLLQRFPALKGTDPGDKIDEALDQLLSQGGLSFVRDVKPWLGTQIALAGRMNDRGEPDFALLIATTDDQKTKETMQRVEGLSSNAEMTWKTETYKGVDIRVGTPSTPDSSGSLGPFGSGGAYGIVDHTLVISATVDGVHAVVDADQGSGDALADDPNFQKARDALPDDVLGMAYVNLGDVIDQLIPQLEAGLGFADLPSGCGGDELNKSLDAARAYRGLALSISAEPDGAAVDLGIAIDRSKLPSAAATSDTPDPHQNVALSFTPKGATGLIAIEGIGGFTAQLDQLEKCQPDAAREMAKYGVKGILSNLAGDIGVQVNLGTSGTFPRGALVAAVKDEGKMRDSLDQVIAQIGKDSDTTIEPATEDYQGVTIKSVQPDESNKDFMPSWAVTDGVVIIGTTPDEVKAAIDAHGGENITDDPTFQQAVAHVDSETPALFYVDVRRVLDFVEATAPDIGDGMQPVLDNIRPIKATVLASSTDEDVVSVRWFFLIP